MNYKDWEILKVIQEEKNLTGAAKKLFLSQPALSFRLKKMEREFNVPILVRHATGVFFTPQGEQLLLHGVAALEGLERIKEEIGKIDQEVVGTVRLGISSVVARFKMASLLQRFQEQFPLIQIELTTGSSTLQLPNLVDKEEIDIAILRGNPDWSEVKHTIDQENWCWVGKEEPQWSKLATLPWIQYEASSITKSLEMQYKWWNERFDEVSPKIIRVDSIEACLEMISHGFGWSLVPKTHLGKRRSLIHKPVFWQSGEPLLWDTTMICKEKKPLQPTLQNFIHYVLNEYSRKK